MRWLKWSIATGEPGDFLPALLGCIFLFLSLPAFIMLLVNADPDSGPIAGPLLVLLGAGSLLGVGFIVFGIRINAYPGTFLYRLTRGRILTR